MNAPLLESCPQLGAYHKIAKLFVMIPRSCGEGSCTGSLTVGKWRNGLSLNRLEDRQGLNVRWLSSIVFFPTG